MTESEAADFRRRAEAARLEAEKSVSGLEKEAWLIIAEEWLKLAQSAESRP